MRTFLIATGVIGLFVIGFFELDGLRVKSAFPGMDEYKTIQAEIDAEAGRTKTVTNIGSVIK